MYLPAKECVRKGTWVQIPHSLPVLGCLQQSKNFTVNEAKNSLAVDGISKAAEADYTKYTADALSTYEKRSVDPKLAQYGSKLIQKYLATKADTQFKTINEATSGIKLVYNPS